MDIGKTMENLKGRGFGVKFFETGAEAAEYLRSELSGLTVGFGGSKTLQTIGIADMLDSDKVFWHWGEKRADTLTNAANADAYLSSANAISESGEIINIDGTGNRISSLAFGHKKVYIVAGVNKISPNFHTALDRARNVAAVQNCRRFETKKTPCKSDGVCHDCRSKDRICNGLLVLWAPMSGTQTEVVLINEELGM